MLHRRRLVKERGKTTVEIRSMTGGPWFRLSLLFRHIIIFCNEMYYICATAVSLPSTFLAGRNIVSPWQHTLVGIQQMKTVRLVRGLRILFRSLGKIG